MKKVVFVLRPEIESLPPCITQINSLLELGFEVVVITMHVSSYIENFFRGKAITFSSPKRFYNDSNALGKILNIIEFRKFLKSILKDKTDSILWIGSLDTAQFFKSAFLKCDTKKTVLNIFELYDKYPRKLKQIMPIAQKSDEIIVPEYNRAHILKVWLKLNRTPVVIPNKPYIIQNDIEPKTLEIVNNLKSKNKKIILYQGWIADDRDITVIADALNILNDDDYLLVLMGKETKPGVIDIIKGKYRNVEIIPFLNPPQHLFVTETAYIGIATYDDSSLNNIFCAPNKIYEYALKRVPILARDIPGLRNTVCLKNTGVCVDTNNTERIIEGIKAIEEQHSFFAESAFKFQEECNILEKYRGLIENLLNESTH